MNNHLSQDQLSMWLLGRYTAEELRHGRECLQCRAELAQFEAPVSAFRSVMLEWSDGENAPRSEEVSTLLRRPQAIFNAIFNTSWAWVAVGLVVILLTAVPIYKQEQALMQRMANGLEVSPSAADVSLDDAAADANAAILMDAVSTHLSRTVPAPMEPIMALIPAQEDAVKPGGTK